MNTRCYLFIFIWSINTYSCKSSLQNVYVHSYNSFNSTLPVSTPDGEGTAKNIAKWHKIMLYSLFRTSSFYINKIQKYATRAGIYYCKITVHVSVVYRPHHQECIKL
jgi:hypothetical protein